MTQETALSILKTGVSVFLTGEPGSGKTHTINAYVAWLREHGVEPALTASTGIAATHIGGMTIHSWSGIGVREYLDDQDLDTIATNKKVVDRVRDASVLIIDEVSMLSGDTLGMVEQVTRCVRGTDEAFGGMQVVLVGDFFQLPPVVKKGDAGMFGEDYHAFAFGSRAWGELKPVVCYLSEQHRHEDNTLAAILAAIRTGDIDDTVYEALGTRRAEAGSAPSGAPHLFSHNVDVDRINDEQLRTLAGREHRYTMTTRGAKNALASLVKGCLSPEILTLKEGARVMFTKNDSMGRYANGTLGTVESFAKDGAPMVRTDTGQIITVTPVEWTTTDGGSILARIEQLPLRLAWAMTVHKSQGMTLDSAAVDLSKAFVAGQGYVALSRVRTLDGLAIHGWNATALVVDRAVLQFDHELRKRSELADERFGALSEDEREQMARRFIVAAGGTPEGGVKYTPKEKEHKPRAKKGDSLQETLTLIKRKKSIKEIMKERGLAESTIYGHVYDLYIEGLLDPAAVRHLASSKLIKALPDIAKAFDTSKGSLKQVFESLKGVYSYHELRLAQILLGE